MTPGPLRWISRGGLAFATTAVFAAPASADELFAEDQAAYEITFLESMIDGDSPRPAGPRCPAGRGEAYF
ncbi:MAG: hypothetical protein ACR2MO_08155 [Acidimicrobiales bacterium]